MNATRKNPYKFTVLEEPKEEQNLTFSDFYSINLKNVYKLRGLFKGSIKLDIQENKLPKPKITFFT